MRVLKRDLKGNEGEISLLIESLDDLWHLKYLVHPGDLVFSLTQRKVLSASDKLRPEKTERRTMRLGVSVESVEFHTYSNWLRIHGVIKAGMDVGSYHTINIEVGKDLSIVKHWRADELQRIEEAVAASRQPKVVLALVEEGEATLGVLRQFGVQMAGEVRMGSGKGASDDRRDEFLREVASMAADLAGEDAYLVIAGPGFTKEDLKAVVERRYPQVMQRVIMDDASGIGRSGFQEVLRRGSLERIMEENRLALEVNLIEELFREICKDGRGVYGSNEVEEAANLGAVETLMILDEVVRKGYMDPLIRQVMNSRGKVVVFSSEFEPGERLAGLGGIAALTRFKTVGRS